MSFADCSNSMFGISLYNLESFGISMFRNMPLKSKPDMKPS